MTSLISTAGLVAKRLEGKYRLDHALNSILPPKCYSRAKLVLNGASRFPDQFHRKRLIFVHIPKNGGSSISQALFADASLTHQHHRLLDYFVEAEAATCEYFKFAVIRNPWDRLVSAYFYLRHPPPSVGAATRAFSSSFMQLENFEDFVTWLSRNRWAQRWPHLRPQWEYISVSGMNRLDASIRFEHMAQEFAEVMGQAGVTAQRTLPHINESERSGSYRNYYSEHTRKIVQGLYVQDVGKLGYEF